MLIFQILTFIAEIFDAQTNVQAKFWQEKHNSSHEVIKTLQNEQSLRIILMYFIVIRYLYIQKYLSKCSVCNKQY